MPEPLDSAYLKKTQEHITAVPPGPWTVEVSDHGVPDSVGPISYVETWSSHHQVPVVEFIRHAREALPRFLGEVARLTDRAKNLENGSAFPWAAHLDADQLAAFLEELHNAAADWDAQDGLQVLQKVEKVIAASRPAPNGGASHGR